MMRHSHRIWPALLLAAFGLFAARLAGGPPDAAAAEAKKKMAMIFPGSIQDADYNTVGYLALQETGKTYGLEVSQSENVAVADAERISREYINAGYEIVAYHGGQFPTIPLKLAPLFPNVVFIQETSGRLPNTPPNFWTMSRKWFRGFYILGTLGALTTKTNKIGYIAGVRIPDSVANVNAIQTAIKEHNPKAELLYTHVGDFNDPVKARQAAEAQINSGVDFIIIFVNYGQYGVIEAAKAAPRPVLLTTHQTEKWDLAPKVFTASLNAHFVIPYREVVGRILKGERTGYYEMTVGRGLEISDIRNIPQEVAAKVRAITKEVVAGKPIPEITDKFVTP
jgi:basic membrane protein A and related proteins